MEIKISPKWQETENKYKDFYEYIKQLVKNGNLEEKIVRRKIEEIEKEIKNEKCFKISGQ